MAKDRISAAIQVLETEQKKREMDKVAIQCDCVHHPDNDPSSPRLIKVKDAPAETLTFKCTRCKDVFSLSGLSDTERDNAINTVIAMCNIIKLKANLANDEDKEIAKKAAKLQYKLRTWLPKAYAGAKKADNKKNRRRNNNGGSMWQKPGIAR